MPGDQPEEKTRAHDVLVTICAAVWRAAAPGRGAAACRRPSAQTSRPPGRRQRDGRRSWVHVGVSTMLGHLRVRHLPLGTTLLADIEPRGQGAHLGRRLRGSAVDLVSCCCPLSGGCRLAAKRGALTCLVMPPGQDVSRPVASLPRARPESSSPAARSWSTTGSSATFLALNATESSACRARFGGPAGAYPG